MTSKVYASVLLGIAIIGASIAQVKPATDAGLNRNKQETDAVRTTKSTQIPTPGKQEVVMIFLNGDFVVARIGQRISVPNGEKFRAVYGEAAQVSFFSKGQASGNDLWDVTDR